MMSRQARRWNGIQFRWLRTKGSQSAATPVSRSTRVTFLPSMGSRRGAKRRNVESLFHRGEFEVAQQAIKPAEHAVQATVVTESRNERYRQPGLVGIYFPRMHVEHCRDTPRA